MDFSGEIREEESFLKNILVKFRKKDFSGTTGQAMKNSSYQLAQNLIFKFGSLLFTIVIARMLLPERMGLYNLALATIILFVSFSDLGISSALITYCSKLLGRGDLSKAKGYVKKLFKWKLILILCASIILLISAYFIAEFYYQKPIFYALLVGAIYLPVISLIGFLEQIFKTNENFKTPMQKEILFQIIRFIFVPLGIFLFLEANFSNQGIVSGVLLTLVFSYLVALIFLALNAKKKIKFLQESPKKLEKKSRKTSMYSINQKLKENMDGKTSWN